MLCSARIEQRKQGWHDPEVRKVVCTDCWGQVPRSEMQPTTDRPDPIGGSSALKWAGNGRGKRQRLNRQKGAAGEYLMDRHLHQVLDNGEVILNDRQIPGGFGNIDHVVVAASGVWIIDMKNWSGKIQYRSRGGMFDVNERLFVNGSDRTDEVVDHIYSQVIPVAAQLEDRSIPVQPAVVILADDWVVSPLRVLANKPYKHKGVWISWPKAISSKIKERGPLSPDKITEIGALLNQKLVPMN
jgi:hypothetical protein